MSLTEKIRNIQNSTQSIKHNNTKAWKHNEQMIEILKHMGVYQNPAPKSYITEGYTPPAICNVPLTFSGTSQISICSKTQ